MYGVVLLCVLFPLFEEGGGRFNLFNNLACVYVPVFFLMIYIEMKRMVKLLVTILVLCVCYDIPFIKEYHNMINMYLPYYI